MTPRQRVLGLLDGKAVDRPPVMAITMMYAADQIGAKYGAYVKDHRVMVEAQIATAERFGLDYVSGISDPGREAADLGAAVKFFDDQPPAIDEANALLSDKAVLAGLKRPEIAAGGRRLDRVQAMGLFKRRVGDRFAIEGWVEGPCAEGADLRGLNTLMLDFYDDPAFVRDLFEFTLAGGLAFAKAQIEAGADLIGVGDAAASLLGPAIYNEFVWPYEKRLVDGIRAMGSRVRLHICGNINRILEPIGRLGCAMADIDFLVPLADARRLMGPEVVLLGNIDPVRALRDGTPDSVRAAMAECHRQAGPRYILGAGCEVPRGTPPENLMAMTAYAQAAGR